MDEALRDELIDSLLAALERVEGAVRSVARERWDDVIHSGDGPWTRREVLAHMAANDLRQLVRIRIGAGIPEPGDDLEHAAELETHDWNRARVAERVGLDVPELLAEMRENRGRLVALLRGLSPDRLDRAMPFRGVPTPLAEMVPVLIGHLDGHARELVEEPSRG